MRFLPCATCPLCRVLPRPLSTLRQPEPAWLLRAVAGALRGCDPIARRGATDSPLRPFGVKAYADDGQAGPVSRDSTQVPRVRRPPHGQGGRIQSKPEKPPFPLPPATAAAAQPRGAPCLRAVSGGRGTACSLPRSRPQQPPHPDGSSTSSTATAAKSVKTAVAAAAMLN